MHCSLEKIRLEGNGLDRTWCYICGVDVVGMGLQGHALIMFFIMDYDTTPTTL